MCQLPIGRSMQHGRTEVQITEKYALAHRDVAKPDAVHLCDPETEDLCKAKCCTFV